jgi:hypothetical protein
MGIIELVIRMTVLLSRYSQEHRRITSENLS